MKKRLAPTINVYEIEFFFTKQTIKDKLRNLLQRLFRDYNIILVNCVTLRCFSLYRSFILKNVVHYCHYTNNLEPGEKIIMRTDQ